ncbi:hypothetical protein MJ547_04210, partial [Burkholderia gladioli]
MPHFKTIHSIGDVRPAVADKKEIRFLAQPNGLTIGCYLFADNKTFDSPEALECRGIAFGADGNIVSRPLHKFFNVGEKDSLTPDLLLARDDIAAVFEKLDGSMIATAWVDGRLMLRSKKSFTSEVVHLANAFLAEPANQHIRAFAEDVASRGLTAIFELTHPDARIVVEQEHPALRLLHVRENVSGDYVLLDSTHVVHDLIEQHSVPLVPRYDGMTVAQVLDSLDRMEGREGFVIQFRNGDMTKVKCPWYVRLHRSISFLRERDIARLAIEEELDDVKGALVEAGVTLTAVEEVEARLKSILAGLMDQIEAMYEAGRHLDRKDFALANKGHPLFGLAMTRFQGKEVPILDWYARNRLKDDFGLRTLVSDTLAEAMEG